MNYIRYELFRGGAAVASCDFSDGNLTLNFPTGTDGFVRIGARIYKLVSAKAEINWTELDDGIHTPHLFTSFDEYALPGFVKQGKSLTLAPLSNNELRYVELCLRRTLDDISSLEKQVGELRNMIQTSTLF